MTATITREELVAKIERREPMVIAEALPEPYWRKEHIPGAIALPMDEVEARAERLFPDRRTLVVLYCANVECYNSHIAAERLIAMGYADVRVYEGGKADWRAAGLPLQRG
jgi:rhodanese-related sulfurtransferase